MIRHGDLPNATGRDNKYHQYLVTITPTPGFVGDVTVTVGAFDDMEKPTAKKYVPLVKSQRLDTTLAGTPGGTGQPVEL